MTHAGTKHPWVRGMAWPRSSNARAGEEPCRCHPSAAATPATSRQILISLCLTWLTFLRPSLATSRNSFGEAGTLPRGAESPPISLYCGVYAPDGNRPNLQRIAVQGRSELGPLALPAGRCGLPVNSQTLNCSNWKAFSLGTVVSSSDAGVLGLSSLVSGKARQAGTKIAVKNRCERCLCRFTLRLQVADVCHRPGREIRPGDGKVA